MYDQPLTNYNVNVHIVSKRANRVLFAFSKGGLVSESGDSLLTV